MAGIKRAAGLFFMPCPVQAMFAPLEQLSEVKGLVSRLLRPGAPKWHLHTAPPKQVPLSAGSCCGPQLLSSCSSVGLRRSSRTTARHCTQQALCQPSTCTSPARQTLRSPYCARRYWAMSRQPLPGRLAAGQQALREQQQAASSPLPPGH